MPGWYFAHAQDDLNLRVLRMFEGSVSLDVAYMEFAVTIIINRYFYCTKNKTGT